MEEIVPQLCSWCIMVLLLWLAKLEMDRYMWFLSIGQTVCEKGNSVCPVYVPCSIDLGCENKLRVHEGGMKRLAIWFRTKVVMVWINKLQGTYKLLLTQTSNLYNSWFSWRNSLPSDRVQRFLGEWGCPATDISKFSYLN